MMNPWYGHFGMGGGFWMMLLGFLIIGTIFYLLFKKQHVVNESKKTTLSHLSPLPIEIAKSRLASGEISIEEFEQIKKQLEL